MGRSEKSKPLIVFIISSAFSGSTLLDKTLGNHSSCFSLGELDKLPAELSSEKNPCGCTRALIHCPFWQQVNNHFIRTQGFDFIREPEKLRLMPYPVDNEGHKKHGGTLQRFLFYLPFLSSGQKNFQQMLSQHGALYEALFQTSEHPVLIDSGKGLLRAVLLKKHLKNYRVRFIHLVRNGMGVLHSSRKTEVYDTLLVEASGDLIRQERTRQASPPQEMIRQWKWGNLTSRLILKVFYRKSSFFLRHEDFTANPEKELKSVAAFMGIPYEKEWSNLKKNTHHMVNGNASRFFATEIVPSDNNWEQKLPVTLLQLFRQKAGGTNRFFGYRNTQEHQQN